MNPVPRVLLLGSIDRILLAAARSLGRGGVEVDIAYERPQNVATRSRYVRSSFLLPKYSSGSKEWIAALLDLLRRSRYQLVIPCGDWETLLCHHHRDELGSEISLAIPEIQALETLIDKRSACAFAKSKGVRVPEETLLDANDTYLPKGFEYPLVLKPCRSFIISKPGSWQRVIKVRSDAELVAKLRRLKDGESLVAQSNFIGTGVGVELLLLEGEPLLSFQHERIHQPADGGPSSYRKSVELSSDLLEAAVRVLKPLRYTGVAMVEFIVAPDSGEYVFLEVNTRLWGSLPLSVSAGIDFSLALFQLYVDGRNHFSNQYRKNIYSRHWRLDKEWFLDRVPEASRYSRILSGTLQMLMNLVLLRERSDTFALDDPLPAFTEIRQIAVELSRRLRVTRK